MRDRLPTLSSQFIAIIVLPVPVGALIVERLAPSAFVIASS